MALVRSEDLKTPEQKAREWRDQELSATDYIVPLSDHPQLDDFITYREALRQWPTLNEEGEYINGFPNTRPVFS
jgi:hypothetical protein